MAAKQAELGHSLGHSEDLDPVEGALAAGLSAIAASMSRAASGDLIALVDRMTLLTRELEARRLARAVASNVIEISRKRK